MVTVYFHISMLTDSGVILFHTFGIASTDSVESHPYLAVYAGVQEVNFGASGIAHANGPPQILCLLPPRQSVLQIVKIYRLCGTDK
jgi:hypothetical protein